MRAETTYTHQRLASLLGVSVTTIKSYRRKFPGCVPVASQGKPIRFPAGALEICTRIRDLFAEGMSIPEVNSRLAEEFSWTPPQACGKAETPTSAKLDLPPLYTTAMSDMAQSLVGLAQKQGAVLDRLEEIGTVIGNPNTAPAECPASLPQATAVPQERPAWLDEFAGLSRQMADAVVSLEGSVERLNQWAQTLASHLHEQAGRPLAPPVPAAPPGTEAPQQPDRGFMTMPLVIVGQDGKLHGIAGPGRGRFTCADLRALAACAEAPERACTLAWGKVGPDWQLAVHGRESEQPLAAALLREVSDSAGNTAVLLQQAVIHGQEGAAADFLAFLRDRAR